MELLADAFINCLILRYVATLFVLKIATAYSSDFDDLCLSILPEDYRLFEAPEQRLPVFIDFDVMDIGEIDEGQMDYMMQVFVTTTWKDKRIKVDKIGEDSKKPVFFPKECIDFIWKPTTYFETAKKIDLFKSTAPAITMCVYNDKRIQLNMRYMFQSSCNMYFKNYPFDMQSCQFLVSLISPDFEAILHWSSDMDPTAIPVEVFRDIQPLQFSLGEIRTGRIVDLLPDANYTTLVADIVFHRRLVGSVINTFIPSTLIVAMSWVGFWLGTEAVPARVALSVTSLLTLCTQAQQYQSQLPPVNYVKAIDIWLFVCISLVFSTLLEFAVAHNTVRKQAKFENQKKALVKERERRSYGSADKHASNRADKSISHRKIRIMKRKKQFYSEILSKMVDYFACFRTNHWENTLDKISQVVYPTFFLLFATVYWAHYLRIYFNYEYV